MADPRLPDELQRFWDAVLRDEPAIVGDLDPALTETIRQLRARDRVEPPDRIFVKHLREELISASPLSVPIPPRPGFLPNGRIVPSSWRSFVPALPLSGERRRWALAQFATAILLLVTLVAIYFAFGPGRPQWAFVPTVEEETPATSAPGVSADTVLLQATVEDALPELVSIVVERLTLAPGAEVPFGSTATSGEGPNLFRIESGAVILAVDGPALVTHAAAGAGSPPTPVAAGSEVALAAGDQAFTTAGVTSRRRNEGSVPAVTLELSLTADESSKGYPGASSVQLAWGLYLSPPRMPAVVALRRLTLRPGASLAVGDLPGLEEIYVEAGTLDVVYAEPGDPATPTNPLTAARPLTIGNGAGVAEIGRLLKPTARLSNPGDEPLVFLVVTIIPTGADTGTPPP